MNSKFLSALEFLLGCLDDAWDIFVSSLPAIAVTMLVTFIIISIVIDRLINPMIGKGINGALDTVLYDTKKQVRAKRARDAQWYRVKGHVYKVRDVDRVKHKGG